MRKYDVLANELCQLYKCKSSNIIPYVINWDGVVTNYHKKYIKELEVTTNIEAYIQFKVLKATLESLSFECRKKQLISKLLLIKFNKLFFAKFLLQSQKQR